MGILTVTSEEIRTRIGAFQLNLPVTLLAGIVGAVFTAGVVWTQLGNWQETDKNRAIALGQQITDTKADLLQKILDTQRDLGRLQDRVNQTYDQLNRNMDLAKDDRQKLDNQVAGLSAEVRGVSSQIQFLLSHMPSAPDGSGWGTRRTPQ